MNEFQHFKISIDEQQILWMGLHVHENPANILNTAVLLELIQACRQAEQSPPAGLILYSTCPESFISGSDIHQLRQLKSRADALKLIKLGQTACQVLASLPFPTLALIDGCCLGNGLELTLAMSYRIAADTPATRFSFPDTRFGLFPVMGGLPRTIALMGARNALNLIFDGHTLSARQAADQGLVDLCVPEARIKAAAIRFILDRPANSTAPLHQRLLNGNSLARSLLAGQMRRQLKRHGVNAEHYPAPYVALQLWQKHGLHSQAMLNDTAEAAADLLVGEHTQNLLRTHAQRSRMRAFGKKQPYFANHVHVIGAGIMGRDIALCCLFAGLSVSLQDNNPNALHSALTYIAEKLNQALAPEPDKLQDIRTRITADAIGQQIANADVIIEAIPDKLGNKQEIFAHVEEHAKPGALLATTTSSLALERIAAPMLKPERLIGMHFFNPALQLQLVEVGHNSEITAPDLVNKACAFLLHLDKLPLPVYSNKGYVVNRVLFPYILQGIRLNQQGVPHTILDRAGRDFGMPMGPLELADLLGLDYCRQVGDMLARDNPIKLPEMLVAMVNSGKLGRKSGSGFYRYRNGRTLKSERMHWDGNMATLQYKLISQMVEEAALCVEQGVIMDPELLDAAVVFGTGFAPFRGGPLRYALSTRK